jgi:hypothetical protein
MESDRIAIIEDWLKPESIRDLHVLLGFANFYRRFIRKYAKVTQPLTELLRPTEIVWTLKAPGKAHAKPKKPLPKWE